MAEPRLTDLNLLVQAGINPKNGLPIKAGNTDKSLKPDVKKQLRILDEQNAINRYVWRNLPQGLNSQLMERVLYYKGQGAFFYMEALDKFFFLPYTLSAIEGTGLDCYGRFTGITPLPFNGSTSADGKPKPWIQGLQFKPEYDIVMPEELTLEQFTNSCVLISDYSNQYSQTNIARQIIQDPVLDVMSDIIPFMRTALLNSTGIDAMRVQSEDEQSNVEAASRALDQAALTGKKWIPVVGSVDFQTLTSAATGKTEEFMLALQSLDNYRLSLYGLKNGGLFQKKSHMLESEQDMNAGNVGLIMQDGLTLRKQACDIINSIWGLGVYVEVAEPVIGIDRNMSGEIQDDSDNEEAEMAGMTQEVADDE